MIYLLILKKDYKTYNLSIEGYHNYIVEGIVAHNAGCACPIE